MSDPRDLSRGSCALDPLRVSCCGHPLGISPDATQDFRSSRGFINIAGRANHISGQEVLATEEGEAIDVGDGGVVVDNGSAISSQQRPLGGGTLSAGLRLRCNRKRSPHSVSVAHVAAQSKRPVVTGCSSVVIA